MVGWARRGGGGLAGTLDAALFDSVLHTVLGLLYILYCVGFSLMYSLHDRHLIPSLHVH